MHTPPTLSLWRGGSGFPQLLAPLQMYPWDRISAISGWVGVCVWKCSRAVMRRSKVAALPRPPLHMAGAETQPASGFSGRGV